MYERFGLLIDNAWRASSGGQTMAVFSPVSEEEIGRIPSATAQDVEAALVGAARGFAAVAVLRRLCLQRHCLLGPAPARRARLQRPL